MSIASDIRVGVIGCGRIAAVHLRHLRAVSGVKLAALCDVDADRARALAGEDAADVEIVREPADLFDLRLDAVHVLTPPSTHADVAIAALEHGLHVLVEKPMATTATAARRMQAAASQAGRLLCVDHNRLFDPVIVQAREMIANGSIGKLVSVEVHQGVNLQEGGPAAAPLAMWLNLGPHPLYLLRDFIGDIAEWQAVGGTMGELRAVLRGTRGVGYLCFSPGTSPYLNSLTLHGTKATLAIDLNTMTLLVRKMRPLPSMIAKAALNVDQGMQLFAATARTTWQVARRKMGTYPGIGEVIRRFYGAVGGQGELPVTADDGRVVVELLEDVWTRTHAATAAPARPRVVARRASGKVVLVTGAHGFLGRHVVSTLRDQGVDVRALVRTAGTAPEDVEEAVASLGDDVEIRRALEGVRAVVHCAARVAGGGSKAEFFRDNVFGTEHLLTAARAAGVERFVHVSSIAVYGVPPGPGAITELVGYDPQPAARGFYTWSKLEADRLVQQFARQSGLATVTLRPGILVAPDGPGFTARLCVGRFKGRVVIIGDPRMRLPLVHVDDVARAAALALTASEVSGAYNLVDDALTQAEWLRQSQPASRPVYIRPGLGVVLAFGVELAAKALGRNAPSFTRYRVRRATEQVRYDVSRAGRDLGWAPTVGVRMVSAPRELPVGVVEPALAATAAFERGAS
jgi:nucleoside-diphosphate-sugar epimerase/predicted dehydrogenase